MTWGPDDVAAYLHFGYLPRVPEDLTSLPGWGLADASAVEETRYDDLVKRGMAAFASAFDDIPDGPHVVPLSGGLDSRAVLGELLGRVGPNEITTVTVGVPGSLDFDLAKVIAREAGVRHLGIDLSVQILAEDALEDAVRGSHSATWAFDTYYNRLVRQRAGDSALFWSGYLGGVGRRLGSSADSSERSDRAYRDACRRFAVSNRWSKSVDLVAAGVDPVSFLPDSPISRDSQLDFDEQLNLWVRQPCLTRPVNLPVGYRHQAPFANDGVLAHFLSMPRVGGFRRDMYAATLHRAHPDLFAIPTTANAGLALYPSQSSRLRWYGRRIIRAARRRLLRDEPDVWQANYLDLAHALRHRPDYREAVRARLQGLHERRVTPWLDIEQIWNEHQHRERDHAMALTLLASLDIHLDVAGFGE